MVLSALLSASRGWGVWRLQPGTAVRGVNNQTHSTPPEVVDEEGGAYGAVWADHETRRGRSTCISRWRAVNCGRSFGESALKAVRGSEQLLEMPFPHSHLLSPKKGLQLDRYA